MTVVFWPGGGPQATSPSVVANSSTEAGLSWSDRSGGRARYEIRRDGQLIHTTAPGATSYTDTGATPGASHTYEVRAVAPYWAAVAGAEGTVQMPSGGGASLGFGPSDFASSAVITGEDWLGVTEADVLSWNFFFHEANTPPDVGTYIDLEADPLFGTVLKMHQTNANFTVKSERAFSHARAKGAPFVARDWIFSSVIRLSDDWGFTPAVGNPQWKHMHATKVDTGGQATVRIELGSVSEGVEAFMLHTGEASHWSFLDSPVSEANRKWEIGNGDFFQGCMGWTLIGGVARMWWAVRKLTTDGGQTLNPQPWRAQYDRYDPGAWDDNDGITSVGIGLNINGQPPVGEDQFVYYGPWVVLDLSDPSAPADPWGLFTHLGI